MIRKLKVVDSDLGEFAEGTVLEVEDEHTNQFTGRHVLNVIADQRVGETLYHGGNSLQIFQMPDSTKDVWKEIVVGRPSDTILVTEI